MDKQTIDLLTAELESLRIRVEQLEAERTDKRTSAIIEQTEVTPIGLTKGDRVRITNQLEVTPIGLTKGDRVRITNQVRRPAIWPSAVAWNEETKEKERRATVTHIYKDQVHFITDNGTKTWRAPNNVRKF